MHEQPVRRRLCTRHVVRTYDFCDKRITNNELHGIKGVKISFTGNKKYSRSNANEVTGGEFAKKRRKKIRPPRDSKYVPSDMCFVWKFKRTVNV